MEKTLSLHDIESVLSTFLQKQNSYTFKLLIGSSVKVWCVGSPVFGHDEGKGKEKSNGTYQGRKLLRKGLGAMLLLICCDGKSVVFFFSAYVISHHSENSLDSIIFMTVKFKCSRILGIVSKVIEVLVEVLLVIVACI